MLKSPLGCLQRHSSAGLCSLPRLRRNGQLFQDHQGGRVLPSGSCSSLHPVVPHSPDDTVQQAPHARDYSHGVGVAFIHHLPTVHYGVGGKVKEQTMAI